MENKHWSIRDRPFNMQGGYGFLVRPEFFPQNLTLGYMTKTLNQIIFFFLHQYQNIFFSNIGNQNIFFQKKLNGPFLTKMCVGHHYTNTCVLHLVDICIFISDGLWCSLATIDTKLVNYSLHLCISFNVLNFTRFL